MVVIKYPRLEIFISLNPKPELDLGSVCGSAQGPLCLSAGSPGELCLCLLRGFCRSQQWLGSEPAVGNAEAQRTSGAECYEKGRLACKWVSVKLSSGAVVTLEMSFIRAAKSRSLLRGSNRVSWAPEIGSDRRKDTIAPGFSAVHRGGLGKHLSNTRVDRQASRLFYRLSAELYRASPGGGGYAAADVIWPVVYPNWCINKLGDKGAYFSTYAHM